MYGRITFNLAGKNTSTSVWDSDGVVDHRAGSLRSFRPMSAPCEIPPNLTFHFPFLPIEGPPAKGRPNQLSLTFELRPTHPDVSKCCSIDAPADPNCRSPTARLNHFPSCRRRFKHSDQVERSCL